VFFSVSLNNPSLIASQAGTCPSEGFYVILLQALSANVRQGWKRLTMVNALTIVHCYFALKKFYSTERPLVFKQI